MSAGEIQEAFLLDGAYPDSSYESVWVHVGNAVSVRYIVYCGENLTMKINWAFDTNYDIVYTDTFNLTGGEPGEIYTQINGSHCQFVVDSIASNPCVLHIQAFYLLI